MTKLVQEHAGAHAKMVIWGSKPYPEGQGNLAGKHYIVLKGRYTKIPIDPPQTRVVDIQWLPSIRCHLYTTPCK